jgi:hypothetical protein
MFVFVCAISLAHIVKVHIIIPSIDKKLKLLLSSHLAKIDLTATRLKWNPLMGK